MKPPFRLVITETTSRRTWERVVDALPATLGRGARSTVVFAHATISKRHAELVLDRGDLVLLDQASHNGTLTRERSERVDGRVRLRDVGYAFSIGVFDVRVTPLTTRGATRVLGEADAPRDATKEYADAGLAAARLDGSALSVELAPLVERYRNAFADLFLGISEGVSDLEPTHRAQWLRNFLAQHDELTHEPMICDLLASIDAPPGASAATNFAGMTPNARGGEGTMLELPPVGRQATRVLQGSTLAAGTDVDDGEVAAKESP